MPTPLRRSLLLSALALVLCAPVRAADCALSPTTVLGADRAELALACQGAQGAFEFFAAAGVPAPPNVVVELVSALPAGVPADALGCYAVGRQRVIVLHHAAMRQRRLWYGVRMDVDVFRAVVTHEVAHAIARRMPGARELPIVAYEYLAYAAMFAAMPEATRDKALAAVPGNGFDHEQQINILTYLFDPAAFGADAYRHWASRPDARGFVRRVLDGTAIRERVSD